MPVRPRRSCLYMPGSNPRALAKAASLPADVVILDLEDAVAPESKSEARDRVAAAVAAQAFGGREVVIRINSLDTPWGAEDLRAAAAAGPDAILAPKVSSVADLEDLHRALEAEAAPPTIGLWAMIETPRGVLACADIAACAARTRLAALVAGSNDLAKDLRIAPDPQRRGLRLALSTVVLAARAHGLVAIDGVFNGIGDEAGLVAECRQGRALGFEGKSLIHPSQLSAANREFAPAQEEYDRAEAIIAAFAAPENAGRGVLRVDGEMVELLHLEEARHLITLRAAIAEADQLSS